MTLNDFFIIALDQCITEPSSENLLKVDKIYRDPKQVSTQIETVECTVLNGMYIPYSSYKVYLSSQKRRKE